MKSYIKIDNIYKHVKQEGKYQDKKSTVNRKEINNNGK